jgi:hypothetical protein|tara:strand:- start:202 stop:516 length:315 start_codon:yes stop_codon:yes gene_type:complete
MATYYFNIHDGSAFTDKAGAGDEAVAAGRAVKRDDVPDGVEPWRLSWNGSAVVVFAEGKDEAGAVAQRLKDGEDEAAANLEKEQEIIKAQVAHTKKLKEDGLEV